MTQDEKVQRMSEVELAIENNEPQVVRIKGNTYKIRDIKDWVFDKIMAQAVPIMKMRANLSMDDDGNFEDIEQAYKLYKKHRKNFAKISSLFLLGHSNIKTFFFHWVYWRYLRTRFDSSSHFLIYEKVLNDERLLFFYLAFQRVEALAKTRMMMMKVPQNTSEVKRG